MNKIGAFALSANTTMAVTSNMSHYPGTGEFIVAIPWILFFVPVVSNPVSLNYYRQTRITPRTLRITPRTQRLRR